jgi:hypothetical protein
MAITHSTVATLPDEAGKEVNKDQWNDAHVVDDGSLVAAKLSASATDILFGRSTAGAGNGEEVVCTAAGRALLDDAAASNQRTTLGLGTGNSPEFTAVNIGDASDTTVSRPSAGNIAVEGNLVYRAGGTDVPVADGGTGASTAQDARANLGSQFIISSPSSSSSINPLDGTTRFFGAFPPSSIATASAIYVRKACRIKEVRLAVIVTGTLGSTEQATVSVRVNDATDTTVSSVVQYDQVGPVRFDNTALDIALAAGDFFELKVVFPTFVTNPTTVFHIVSIVLE